MTEAEEKLTKLEWHRKIAAELYNHTWNLIDKGENRTEIFRKKNAEALDASG